MGQPSITRRFTFHAAHRLMGHSGKCRGLHGHSYALEAKFYVPVILKETGYGIDFGDIKKIVGDFIDSNFDHVTLLDTEDPLCDLLKEDKHTKLLRLDYPPSCEMLSAALFSAINDLVRGHTSRVTCCGVRLWETENCSAEFFG